MKGDLTPSARVLPFVPRGGLTFGIYHGGIVESPNELACGKPDSPAKVNEALDRLQSGRNFVIRTYLRFQGEDTDDKATALLDLSNLASYACNGRKLDLVLSNWDRTGDMSHWVRFIELAIERYGEYVENLQICEEPNLVEFPGDGRFGHSVQAVLIGVRTAREILRKRGVRATVGFNAVPTSVQGDGFWPSLGKQIDPGFLNALDYVGLNLYVDVGESLVGSVEDAVQNVLTHFRNESLAEAGIPATIPIHISENGWPTGPNRFYTRQAEVLASIVDKVYELRNTLNVTQFELFSLRDADTANPEVRRQFGIMRDDYTPKPAFDTYRRLIQEYGT